MLREILTHDIVSEHGNQKDQGKRKTTSRLWTLTVNPDCQPDWIRSARMTEAHGWTGLSGLNKTWESLP